MSAYHASICFVWVGSLATVLLTGGVAARAGHPQPVKIAVTHLAEELGVPEGQVQVVAVEPVDWPDSSLGLAEPGQAYLTVITPGYRVRLSVGEETYVYHTDRRSRVVRATSPARPLGEEVRPGPAAGAKRKIPRAIELAPDAILRRKPVREPDGVEREPEAVERESQPAAAPQVETPPGTPWPAMDRARSLRNLWRAWRGRARRR